MYVKKFNSFNESLLKGFSARLGSVYNTIKSDLFGSSYKKELKKWDIDFKKIDDKHYQFIHDKKIIADLKIDGMEYNKPVFKLTLYYYDTEIPNSDKRSPSFKFDKQEEQPYGSAGKRFFSTESALDFLISFWSKHTKSGTNKNNSYKIKF